MRTKQTFETLVDLESHIRTAHQQQKEAEENVLAFLVAPNCTLLAEGQPKPVAGDVDLLFTEAAADEDTLPILEAMAKKNSVYKTFADLIAEVKERKQRKDNGASDDDVERVLTFLSSPECHIFDDTDVDSDLGLNASTVDELLALRETARTERDWSTADAIRDKLLELGIVIEDTPDGARWHRN